jgi:cell division septation protein DedD
LLNLKEVFMHRLRFLSWLVICAVLLAAVAPTLPTYAASSTAVIAPVRQGEVAGRIDEIRSEDPDIEDDFSEDTELWSTIYDGTTSVYFKSGELHIAVDEENLLVFTIPETEAQDFYVEVDAIHHEGSLDNQFGFLFRVDEATNYYLFAASSDGYYTLQLHQDDEWISILDWVESDVIETGEGSVNTLGLLVEGDSFTLLINDTVMDEVTDDRLDGIGLALNAGVFDSPPIDIGFDNFRMWHLGTEDAPRDQGPVRIPDNLIPRNTGTPAAETPEADATTTPETEPSETTTPTPEVTTEASGEITSETIAAIQAGEPTYSTDFSTDPTGWTPFEATGATYELVDEALEFVFSEANILTWTELPERPIHYYIQVDATLAAPVEAAEYGIIFNYEDPQNFYLYGLSNASTYSVWRLVDNTWEVLYDWTESDLLEVDEGNTNTLGLLMQEDSYAVVANGEVLAVIDNTHPPLGSLALAAGTFEEADLIMRFDNVMVWDLDENASSLPTPSATTVEEGATPAATDEVTEEPTQEPTEEATAESTEEPTEQPTEEPAPTAEGTETATSGDFEVVAARIDEIVATEPTISDDFRSDNGLWDTEANDFGSYSYERRAFHIEANGEERIVWTLLYDEPDVFAEYSEFYAEFDTSFVIRSGENAAGLVFGLLDTDNFYSFMVDEIGYYQLQHRVNGEYTDLIPWTLSDVADAEEGAVNRLGVLAEDSTITLTINGTVIAQVEDAPVDFGSIALAVQTFTIPEAHSTFDNFSIWSLDE